MPESWTVPVPRPAMALPERRTGAFDLAIFDIAGTTIEEHNAVYGALEQAVRSAGADPTPAQMAAWMGADKNEAITALLAGRAGGGPVTAAQVAQVYEQFRLLLQVAYEQVPPTPLAGVPEAIVALRAAGVAVALTTGFSRAVTQALLVSVGWHRDVVDAVVCAEEVGAGRPAPFMIFEAMRRTGVHDVRRVLVAGDTVLDLRAGTNAGAAMVVGVLTGAMDAAALGRVGHTHLLAGVAELPALLAGQGLLG